MAAFWVLLVTAAEVQHVQFGSTVTLSCDISYLYETTWLKQTSEHAPIVVLCANFKEGQPVAGFRSSHRFSVGLMNRSLALEISGLEEADLALYYCIAKVNTLLTVGKGTVLKVSPSGSYPSSSLLTFYHGFCMFVISGLLLMAGGLHHPLENQNKS
ncbi:hypothetical protein LDENG_00123190 [Lucifuga dentata]|nr:hypothetical protein LDENG_00123190 [Lucifuga dentata]